MLGGRSVGSGDGTFSLLMLYYTYILKEKRGSATFVRLRGTDGDGGGWCPANPAGGQAHMRVTSLLKYAHPSTYLPSPSVPNSLHLTGDVKPCIVGARKRGRKVVMGFRHTPGPWDIEGRVPEDMSF